MSEVLVGEGQDRRAPARARAATEIMERRAVSLLALVAALPSIAAGLFGGGFLTDDWATWLVFDQMGLIDGLWRLAFEQPARPLTAPHYAFIYLVVGAAPVVQSLIMGAINALVVVAAWSAGRRFLTTTVLLPALAFLALAPNHSMTRMWFQVAPYALALALALFAVGELDRGRRISAAALLFAATAMYEGVIVLALVLLTLWVALRWQKFCRWTAASVVAFPAVIAAGSLFALSPKRRTAGPEPFDNAGSFLAGQIGTGLWEVPIVAQLLGAGVLLVSGYAAAAQLPSWRRSERELRVALVGAGVTVVSAAPYFFAGSTFGTTGIFDRNNLVPGVGVALIFGALSSLLWSKSRPAASAAAVLVVAWFAVMQVQDVVRFADAVERGERIVERLAASHIDDRGPILVVPAQESGNTGLADFIYDGDLTGAMRYRHGGDWSRVRLVENANCQSLASTLGAGADEVQVWDWRSGDLQRVALDRIAAVCAGARSGSKGA